MVTGQSDLLVEGIELTVGFGQWRFGLADFEMSADPAIQALLRQVDLAEARTMINAARVIGARSARPAIEAYVKAIEAGE